jgi:hypothetical protein
MHNALAVLCSALFFFFSTSTSALFLPQFRLSPSKPTSSDVANKCTFNLWHKQLITTDAKTNYVQLNEIKDNTNGIVIDIAALRPATERNSYSRICAHQVFAVEGLLDNTNLTISGYDDVDEVTFAHDGVAFSSEESRSSKNASCIVGAWDNVVSVVGSRVSLDLSSSVLNDTKHHVGKEATMRFPMRLDRRRRNQ